MRILVDQDNVLAKWVEKCIEWWNEDKGTSCTLDDIKTWAVAMNLGPHSEDFLRSCMRYPEFYRDLEPIEGAIRGVKKLIDDGHDVLIVTAVPKCAGIAYAGKLEWLRRQMPFFNLNNFISAQRKYLIRGDILLDDGLHNILPWALTGRKAVIFDAPWNRDIYEDMWPEGTTLPQMEEAMGHISRVRHWNEFLGLIDRLDLRNTISDELGEERE